MAQRQLTSENVVEIEGEFDDVSGIADDNEREEDEIAAELGTPNNLIEHKIKVYRVKGDGKRLAWLFDLDGRVISGLAEKLRDEFGTGLYEARIFKNGKLSGRKQIEVELPKHAPQMPTDHNGNALTALVQKQGELLSAALAQLAELKRAPAIIAPPTPNPMTMFEQMGTMMEVMRKMMGPPQPAADPLAMLSNVMALVRDANSEGKEKGMFDIIDSALNSDLLKTFVQTAQQQAPQAQPPQQAPRLAAPQNQPPPNAAPPVATPVDPNAQAFAAFLATLVLKAKKNSDPVLWADVVEDTLDPAMLEQLLAQPDPIALLAQYNPEVATHRDWFAQVIEALTGEGEQGQMPGAPIAAPSGSIDAAIPASPASSDSDGVA